MTEQNPDTPDTEPETPAQAKRRRGSAAPAVDTLDTVETTDGPAEETVDLWEGNEQEVWPGSVHKLVEPIQELVGTPVTGHYNKATVAAVKALQTSLGVPADGRFTPALRTATIEALKELAG